MSEFHVNDSLPGERAEQDNARPPRANALPARRALLKQGDEER
jgi:hypothetical protein